MANHGMTEGNEFAQIWTEAFRTYHETTGRDLKNNPALKTLRTTDDLLAQIEDREQGFENFRKKKAKLWLVLRRTMDQVVTLGGVAQGVLQSSPFAPASAGLGAVLFLIGAAKGVSSAYDCITELLSQLEDFTDRLQEYTKGELDLKLRRKVTAILITLLEIFARSEELIKRDRWKQFFVVAFLGKDEKVAAAMSRLQSLVESEEKLVVSLTYSTAQRTDKTLERTDKAVERTERNISKTSRTLDEVSKSLNESDKSAKEEAERKLVKEQLHTAAVEKVQEIYGQISDQRLNGTGEWITNEPLFEAWMEREDPILWILGGPGAGKSFLSSKIISRLQDIYPQDPQYPTRVSVGYFYIKENDQHLRSLNTILKGIAYQFTCNEVVYRKHAVAVCSSPEKISTATGTWKRLFLDFFGSLQYQSWSTYLVIDGLDEAPKREREILLTLLKDLQDASQQSRARIQISIVGRLELREDINLIWDEHIIFIEVSARKNTADIANYISDRIHRVKILKRNIRSSKAGFDRAELQDEIVEKLTEGANGMFLWVNLMLDQIYNKSRPSEIRAALDDAPQDLARMIRHVFKRLDDDPDVGKEDLNEMLVWVTCALRPLVLGELDVILKLRPPQGEGMLDLEDRLRGQFASFFTLTRDDGKITEDLIRDAKRGLLSGQETHGDEHEDHETNMEVNESDEELGADEGFQSDFMTTVIQFSHASIRDYLVQEGKPDTRKWPSDLGIGIEINNAQYHIAQTCLSILSSATHTIEYKPPNLFDYALEFGMTHLLRVDRLRLSKVQKPAVLRPLFELFYAQSMTERWFYDHVWSIIQDPGFLQCVQDWFADEEASSDQFGDVERSLIRRMASSHKGLLEHLALYSAKRWLADEDSIGCFLEDDVWFLHFYHALDDDNYKGQDGSLQGMEPSEIGSLSLERIYQLSNFGNLERSIRWHNGLAKVLRGAEYIDAAIEESLISLDMSEENPWALSTLARCHAARDEYALAIEWERKTIAAAPKTDNDFLYDSYWAISNWSGLLKDYESAIEASKKGWLYRRDYPDAMCNYIWDLNAASRHEDMLEFVESLATFTHEVTNETLLTELFIGCQTTDFESIVHAAQVLRRLDFIQPAMETAIAVADRRDINKALTLRLELARVLHRYADDKPEAMALLEHILDIRAEKSRSVDPWVVKESSDELSQMYFAEAVAAKTQGNTSDMWISKLETLSTQKKADSDEVIGTTANASVVLGLWHRLHGENAKAQPCFKAKIQECVDILTDDDPNNDWTGYYNLGETLLHAGDYSNAAAALEITFLNYDKLKAAEQAKQELEQRAKGRELDQDSRGGTEAEDTITASTARLTTLSPPAEDPSEGFIATTPSIEAGTLSYRIPDNRPTEEELHKLIDDAKELNYYICDGECKREFHDWTTIYFCEICLDTNFCEQCIDLLKTNRLPFRACSSDHTFFQGDPTADKLDDVTTVKVDGNYMPLTEWLDMLRTKWT